MGRGKEPDSLTRLSMELLISSRAEADLTSAFDWYQKKGPDLGGDFGPAQHFSGGLQFPHMGNVASGDRPKLL